MSAYDLLKNLISKTILITFSLTLLACGGGGGGGSSYPNISYTGATSEATVNESNAKDFPVTALEGSSSSNEANPYASLGSSSPGAATPSSAVIDNSTTGNAQHITMLNILAEQIKNDIIKQQNTTTNSNIVSAASFTIPGSCPTNPGSFVIDDNSTQTNVNASYTYNNYCIGDFSGFGFDIVQNGKINISGSYSADPLILQTLSVSIEYMKLTVRNATETYSEEFSGAITINFDGTTNNTITGITVSTNFQANGLTFKIENLVIDNSGGTFSVSGRFYHPIHGYVDITTTEPFDLVSTNPDKYCSGSLQLTGAGGTIDFTADATCSTFDICYTATGYPTCTTPTTYPWP